MKLLKGAGAPTQAEFHEAIAERSERWYAACLKITHSPELAEDAVQDALLNAWNKRHQFKGTARLDTWIHRIAVNSAVGLLRKHRPGVFLPMEQEPESEDVSPERQRLDEELGQGLAASLSQLSEVERICFVLKHLEQWRLREIAEELDTSIDRVKQSVFRAVKKLRAAMPELKSA